MRRKLVKHGAATLMVSVPRKWCKANELNKGDEVDIEEIENKLMIFPKEITKKRKEAFIVINDENKKDIKNLLTHLYRKGFDRIAVEGSSPSSMIEIRNTVEKLLLGFEITEKNGSKCVIENISEPSEEKYEVIFNKIFLIMKESLEMIVADFESGKLQNMHEIDEIKWQQDRLILFCRRLLMKNYSESNVALRWELLTFLMNIQHSLFYFYKFSTENKIKSDNKMNKILKELKDYFNLFYEVHISNDIKIIHRINHLKSSYQFGKCLEAIEKETGKNAVVYSYIRELFRLIQLSTSPILGEILDKNTSVN